MSEVSPDPRTVVIGVFGRIIEQAAVVWLRNTKFSRGPDSPSSPEQLTSGKCAFCQIHERVAHAHSLIRGLCKRLNPDGSIPPGLGGTVKLAQDEITEVMAEIPPLLGMNPRMDQALIRLGSVLPGINIDLMSVSSRTECENVLAKLNEAEDLAYSVPEIIYRRDVSAQESPQPQTTITVSAEDKEILQTFRDLNDGKITRSDAMTALESALEKGKPNGS